MGEPRDARDTCMGSPYVYGVRKITHMRMAAHTPMGGPYAYGKNTCIDTYFTVQTTRTHSHSLSLLSLHSLSLFYRQASINSFIYSFFVNH